MTLSPLHAVRLALIPCLAWGCDFGIGSGGGCARISQGDYVFPEKDIISASVAARVTQSGLDFLTTRIEELVLAFFDADASGRAIIPLGDLGLGSLSTSLGPLDGEVRDLVVTIDLSRLTVRLVPNSSPARLEVYIEDAEVGLVDGTMAGTIDAFLFTGDVACGLANGPADRVARVTMRLVLELATDAFGALEVRVLPSQFDLQDIAIDIFTDCNRPECLDGLSPGSTGECLECETICPAADFGAELVSILQDAFDDLVDTLLDLLADEIANLVLDGFLNGRPLAVEGTLDVATMLSPVLRWMRGASPLGVLAKPAGEAFRVTGAGPSLGLEVVLDAGIDARAHHACVAGSWSDRGFRPGPRPSFDGLARTPSGEVPYDVGLGVSAALVNEAVWELWKSGALCIAVETEDLATLSAGSLIVTARTLDLLLPGIAQIAGPEAPVRIAVQPRLDLGPDYVTVGDGHPLMTIGLADARVAVEVLVGDGWLRMISFEADLGLGLGLQPRTDGSVGIEIADVQLAGLALPDDRIFREARLDVIAPFVVELALGFLTEQPLTFDLGLSGLTSGLGIPLEAVVAATGPAGPDNDWLAFYVQLREPQMERSLSIPGVEVEDSGPGWMDVSLSGIGVGSPLVPDPGAAAEASAIQLRVAGGRWSGTLAGPGLHRVTAAELWLVGRWPVEARALDELGRAGPSARVAEVLVAPRLTPEPAAGVLVTDTSPGLEASADRGCHGGGVGLLALALASLLLVRRRR